MRPRPVHVPGKPKCGYPYSPAVVAGNLVFVSGHAGEDPATHKTQPTIEAQTEQCLENIKLLLEVAGTSFRDVVKVAVFLQNIEDFEAMNGVYRRYFSDNPPARTTVGASLAGAGLLVEIDMIALLPGAGTQ